MKMKSKGKMPMKKSKMPKTKMMMEKNVNSKKKTPKTNYKKGGKVC